MNSGRYCMETLNTSHQQPPREWGDTTFTSVEDLAELHKAALEAAENSDTIDADLHAAIDEKRQLEASGRRETIKRLTALATRISSLESLVDAAHESADASKKRLHSALWGAWDNLSGRAAQLREKLVAERVSSLRENPVIQSSSLSASEISGMVGQVAEAWPPLRKLHVDRDVSWKMPLQHYVETEKFIAAAEKSPAILEDEPQPAAE